MFGPNLLEIFSNFHHDVIDQKCLKKIENKLKNREIYI